MNDLCPGCGSASCTEDTDTCWRNNGCPRTPPDRIPIRQNNVDPYPGRCRATWRKKVERQPRVWPPRGPALFYPGRAHGLTGIVFLDG